MNTKQIINAGSKITGDAKVIFGPYGTLLEHEIHAQLDIKANNLYRTSFAQLSGDARAEIVKILGCSLEDLSAGAILRNHGLCALESDIARLYASCIIENGSSVLALGNTFRERGLLPDIHAFLEAFSLHIEALREGVFSIVGEKLVLGTSFGPKGDCYSLERSPATVAESKDFHEQQIVAVVNENLEFDWHETVPSTKEAIGIVLAAKALQKPCIVNLNLDYRGFLRDGNSLREALLEIDAATDRYAIGFGLNCCPIEIIDPVLKFCGEVANRVISIYPNASSVPPEHFNEDNGVVHGLINPFATARYLAYLTKKYNIKFIGGCCGYTPRDIGLISYAVRNKLFSEIVPPTDVDRNALKDSNDLLLAA